MSVIETLEVDLVAELGGLRAGFADGLSEAEDFGSRLSSLAAPSLGGSFSSAGAEIRDALLVGLAPLQTMEGQFNTAFAAVGGTITTLAQRIDLTMKQMSGFTEAQLGRMALGFKGLSIAGFSASVYIAGAFGVPLFGPAMLGITALGLAFPKAADLANRAVSRISGYFTMLGSVTRKTLGGLGSVATPITGVGRAARVASQGTRALSMELSKLTGVAAGLGAGGAAVAFMASGIKGAADLTESVNKVQVAFGGASGSIKGMADGLARDFGVPKGEILDAATGIGLMGRAAGQSEKEAAAFSEKLTRLAVDAKSFHHSSLEESLGKIRSALAGQSEPLREWGVLLTEDAVKAEALRLGVARGTGELSEAAKVQARASLIAKGLSYTMGDMANTSGSTANMFDALKGRVGNLATSVGGAFLPAVDTALRGLNGFTAGASAWVERNAASFEAIGNYVSGAFSVVGEGLHSLVGFVGDTVSAIAEHFQVSSGDAAGFGQSILGVFEGIGFAWRNIGSILKLVWISVKEGAMNALSFIEVLPQNLAIIGDYIAGNWKELIVDGVNAVGSVFANLGKNIGDLIRAVGRWLADPTQGFDFNWTPLLDGFKQTAAQLPELIKPQLVSLQAETDKVLDEIGKSEVARAQRLADEARRIKPAAARPGFVPISDEASAKKKKSREPQLAGAVEFGSKEAYSVLAKASSGRGGEGWDRVAKRQDIGNRIAAEQLALARAQARGERRREQPKVLKG